jgi:hypothetical protein
MLGRAGRNIETAGGALSASAASFKARAPVCQRTIVPAIRPGLAITALPATSPSPGLLRSRRSSSPRTAGARPRHRTALRGARASRASRAARLASIIVSTSRGVTRDPCEIGHPCDAMRSPDRKSRNGQQAGLVEGAEKDVTRVAIILDPKQAGAATRAKIARRALGRAVAHGLARRDRELFFAARRERRHRRPTLPLALSAITNTRVDRFPRHHEANGSAQTPSTVSLQHGSEHEKLAPGRQVGHAAGRRMVLLAHPDSNRLPDAGG